MAHRGLTAVLVSGVLLVSSAAVAQEPKGRFSMSPVDGGFVRLDTETGAMSHCTRVDERWTCEAMGDASGDATKQLDRLKKENEELRAEIKRLDDMLGLGDGSRPGLPGPRGPGLAEPPAPRPSFRLPTEREVDGALDYFETMMRKFQDRLKRLEQNRDNPVPGTPAPDAAPPATPEGATPSAPKRAL